VDAHNAQITISGEAEPLRLQCVDLAKRYAAQRDAHGFYYGFLALFALLALGCMIMIVRLLLEESRRRAAAAELGRLEAQRLEELGQAAQ
jgi:hypothetical protein